jgi:hypothetical protein
MSITSETDTEIPIPLPVADSAVRNGTPLMSQLARSMKANNDSIFRKAGPRRFFCYPDPDQAPTVALASSATFDEFSCGTSPAVCDFQIPFYVPEGNGRLSLTAQLAVSDALTVEWLVRWQVKTMIDAQTTLTTDEARSAQWPGVQLAIWARKASMTGRVFSISGETSIVYEFDAADIDAGDRTVVLVPQVQWRHQSVEYINTSATRTAKLVSVGAHWIGRP